MHSGIATLCGCGKAISSDYNGFIVGKELGKGGHALKLQGTVANHGNIIRNSGDLCGFQNVLEAVRAFISSSSVICQTTDPKPLPKRFLHIARSRASSFN